MDDIYWIVTIGKLEAVTRFAFIACIVFLTIFVVGMTVTHGDHNFDENTRKNFRKIVIMFGVFTLTLVGIWSFLPSEKDMYMIYGMGTVVDYCKNNQDIDSLPDNTIEALDTWVNMMNKNK